jgi:hypothetical protein
VLGWYETMKLLAQLFSFRRKNSAFVSGSADKEKSVAEYQREILVNQGRTQFQKLKDLGLSIPVRLA